MATQEVLEALTFFDERFPRQALEQAIERRKEVTPALLDALDYAADNARRMADENSDYSLHIYAMYLLAQFRERRAFPKLIRILTLEEELVDFLLGDTLTEGMHAMLCDTFDDDLPLLRSVIENRCLDEFARGAALDGYVRICRDGRVKRDALLGDMKRWLAAEDDLDFLTYAADSCIDAHMLELIPDVRKLFDEDAIDPMMFGAYDDFIDAIFNYDNDRYIKLHIDDAIAEMESWACFDREKKLSPGLMEIPNPSKPRRNDPCPCGSGKKYKKCCLDAGEIPEGALLKGYPSLQKRGDGTAFADCYDDDAIAVDIPVYKAFHCRAPMFSRVTQARLDVRRIGFLLEAYALFRQLCRREGIERFSDFDARYMVHYRSEHWVRELARLLIAHDGQFKQPDRFDEVRDVFVRFGGKNLLDEPEDDDEWEKPGDA